MATPRWPISDSPPPLPPGEVHVWSAHLERPSETTAAYRRLLSPDERVRADRFRFERDRRRYTVGRGVLRRLLGRYLDQPPSSLIFSYSDYDKPFLENIELGFNLSHSADLALYAFARETAEGGMPVLGVDVEAIRPLEDAETIAERFFSPAENAVFRNVPAPLRPVAFFNCWTRKEAFIKAVGEGLSYPLDQFDVTLAPGEPVQLLRIRGSAVAAREWTLTALDPAAGFVGALALFGREWRIRCFHHEA